MPVGKLLDTEIKTDNKTLGFYAGIAIIGFFIGLNFSKMQSADEIQKMQHDFAIDEVNGLREDVKREVLQLQKQIDELKKE